MARINPNRIRLAERRAMKRYESFGSRVVYQALSKMVDPDNPEKILDPKPMQDAFIQMYTYAGLDSAKREYNRLNRDEPIKAVSDFFLQTWRNWMRSYVQSSLGQMIVDITNNTRDLINSALQDGLEQGLTRTETAKLIREKTLGEIGKRRARTIARTESQTAANEGKERSAEDWSKERGQSLYKLWIHSASKNERPTHVAMGLKPPIPKEAKFNVDGHLCDYPTDVNLPASERIQCNCIAVYMSERKARRDYNI